MRGILDAAEMGVDNPVAAIGDKNVAIPGLADRHFAGNAGLSEGLGKGVPGHRQGERDHLHRQRIIAERFDPFAVVGDDDHAIGGSGDDLLAQQCDADALDQVERRVAFVGAVDRKVEPVDLASVVRAMP